MRKFTASLLAVTLIFAASCASKSDTVPMNAESVDESAFVYGALYVCLDDSLASLPMEKLSSRFASCGVTSVKRLFNGDPRYESRHRKAGLHRWFLFSYDRNLAPATKAGESVSASEGVCSACVPRKIKLASASSPWPFNDPYASKQWYLYNDGTAGDWALKGADINVLPVWKNSLEYGSSDVIVAVMDEGIDLSHEDLAGVVLPCSEEGGSRNFVEGLDPLVILPHSHATHVGGIIAAVNGNGRGTSSVAGGKDGRGGVKIMNCQIFHGDEAEEDDPYISNVFDAFVWAADHGAVIANNSWSFSYDRESDIPRAITPDMPEYPALQAIDYFIKYAGCDNSGRKLPDSPMQGGLVLFSAGNSQMSGGWPSMYEKVLAVGATGPDLRPAYYTNYGGWVDICAPGGNYHVGKPDESVKEAGILSLAADNGYEWMQGTSMSCPLVSGAAALILSYLHDKGVEPTPDELRSRLEKGANHDVEKFFDRRIGPFLDVYSSLMFDAPSAAQVSDLKATAQGNRIVVDFTAPSNSETCMVIAGKSRGDVEDSGSRFLPDGVFGEEMGTVPGNTYSCTLDGLECGSVYYVSVLSSNASRFTKGKIVEAATSDACIYPEICEKELFFSINPNYGRVKIVILNSAGAVVYSTEADASECSPFSVDISSCAPGIYSAQILYDGKAYSQTVLKK